MKLYEAGPFGSAPVRWTLKLLDLPYESVAINEITPEFLRVNAAGKLPVLDDHGFILTESPAIMIYLAQQHPDRGLLPPSRLGQAQVHRWMFFCVGELEARLRAGEIDEFAAMARVLHAHLENRTFVVGDGLTIADVLLACTLDGAPLEGMPGLSAYVGRLFAMAAAPARRHLGPDFL